MSDRVAESKERILVIAMLSGHELTHWKPLKSGDESMCQRCGKKVAVWKNGTTTSFLAETCPGKQTAENQEEN